ncbi:EF-hand domain-containing family member C2 [Ochotona princeps]|uniref:EF-hand domain-containing family member C2 n=1 Tax=Ochotona princeps TaxID=9978 RepID=UPI002714987D|nr:EF-hand domain-containing family member C2 [Ochotona princeps]
MALPALPGNNFNRDVGKEKFHKTHHWDFCNNVPLLLSEATPGLGGDSRRLQKLKPKYTAYPKGDGSNEPSWAAFDKQVLCFDAYWENEVVDRSHENYIIRYFKIYFYPEDDTIQVNEPKVKNSGMLQGVFFRRHRIPLPPPNDDQFYTVYHFNINIEIVFYGWKFKIYNCDSFTGNFLKKVGIKLNPPGQCPEDPYIRTRKETVECMQPLRPYEPYDTLRQFLLNDKRVLHFFCLWDDTESMFGDRKELVLHYFLTDDTIEIREVSPRNPNRDCSNLFLRRNKLPKFGPPGVCQPGQITDRIVLNMYGNLSEISNLLNNRGPGYIMDKCQPAKVDQEFYKDSDLIVGSTINVWGRNVLLCDCDEFTKFYYRTKYGIEEFASVSCKPPPAPKIERKYPPYTGFGSEEDSLRSCIGLIPTPPRKNFLKSMEGDSYGNISNTLRFFAKLETDRIPEDDRIFVLAYYLGDDTISVFEPLERNSGFTGGMFLKRSRVKKPGQEVFKSEPSVYIKSEELYIGVTVNVNGYLFKLLNADEFTLKYMEKNSDRFPYSNLELALKKMKELEPRSKEIKQVFAAADSDHTKVVEFNTFRDLLLHMNVKNLTEQDIITIARHYRAPDEPCPQLSILIAKAHDRLKKSLYENFDTLILRCMCEDREQKHVLPTKDIRRLCKASRLPLKGDLLESLLAKFEDSDKQINYKTFFTILNWRLTPMPNLTAESFLKEVCEDIWFGMPSPIPAKYIQYLTFLKDVFGLDE